MNLAGSLILSTRARRYPGMVNSRKPQPPVLEQPKKNKRSIKIKCLPKKVTERLMG